MNDKFFDVRFHKPQKGQVIVNYRALAELVDGDDKRHLVELLIAEDKISAALQYMRNVFSALDEDTYNVCVEILEDLSNGFSKEDVCKKPYKYTLSMFFYTYDEHIPDDIHWVKYNILKNSEEENVVSLDK